MTFAHITLVNFDQCFHTGIVGIQIRKEGINSYVSRNYMHASANAYHNGSVSTGCTGKHALKYIFQMLRYRHTKRDTFFRTILTHLSLASLLWDMGKPHSPRCDAAERGVPSGAILFAQKSFIEK